MIERNAEKGDISQRSIVVIAFNTFVDVTRDYPDLVPFQAAKIALFCQKTNKFTPVQLGSSLLKDQSRIKKLVLLLNSHHSINNNEEKPQVFAEDVHKNIKKILHLPSD